MLLGSLYHPIIEHKAGVLMFHGYVLLLFGFSEAEEYESGFPLGKPLLLKRFIITLYYICF